MFRISTVRAGILAFYAISGFFAFIENLDPSAAEGLILWFGRFAGALIGFGLVLSGLSELGSGEIREELEGRPGEPWWRLFNKALVLYAVLGGAYRLYRHDYWDGAMLFCYPAWLGILRLELRKRAIEDGSRKLPGALYLPLWLSAATLAVSFALTMLLPQGGPAFTFGRDYYRLFPFLTLVSVPFVIIGAILTGGRLLNK